MKTVGACVAGLLVMISAAVGVVAALGGRSAFPNTPDGVALAYLEMIKSGDCADAANLLYDLEPELRTQCRHNPSLSAPEVLNTKVIGEHVPGVTRVYQVTVTFMSQEYGWVAYSPFASPQSDFPDTLTWQLQVGQVTNGRFLLLPPALP